MNLDASQTTQVVTYKTLVPMEHRERLNALLGNSWIVIKRMFSNRAVTSSKFYREVPCVVAKSLSSKYQRNWKCKRVHRLCIPVCGDKGKQVKIVEGGIRVPALFKKAVIPCQFPLHVDGTIRQIECRKIAGEWFMSYTYNTKCADPIVTTGVVGVDRNSVGNVAVLADPTSGTVRHLGFNPARTKSCWRKRKANLQRQGKRRLLSRIRKKHARQTTYQNHCVSRQVVDYAHGHSRAIALERLCGVTAKGSKIRSYSERNQWAFAQLAQFIQYKARLSGVPVVEVDPAYTSQTCSRCGERHKPKDKLFRCPSCGHQDHRDANASFNIAMRGCESIGGLAMDSARHRSGLLMVPALGSEVLK